MARRSAWQYIVGAAVLIPITGALSFQELRYVQGSSKAEATILNVTEHAGSGRRSQPRLEVEYTFTDAQGKPHHDTDKVPLNWNRRVNAATIPVQYLTSDPGTSRLDGHDNMPAVWVFLGALVALAGTVVWHFVRKAKA